MLRVSTNNHRASATLKSSGTASATDSSSEIQLRGMPAPKRVNGLQWSLSTPQERCEILGNLSHQTDDEISMPGNDRRQSEGPLQSSSLATFSQRAMQQQSNNSLADVNRQFRSRFAESAQNKLEFHQLMQNSFGGKYDFAKAENIRQQSLKGDFSWMPEIRLVDGEQLADSSGTQGAGIGKGAYSAEKNTIYLSRELLESDPAGAEKALAEEVGHAIDAKINTSDTRGDEGAVFSRLIQGEKISASELTALQQEGDSGTIDVNGEKIEVEFSWLSKGIRSIGKGLSSAGKAVGKAFSDGARAVGKGISKGIHFVSDKLIKPVLGKLGPVGRFLNERVVEPSVGLIDDGINMAVNTVQAGINVATSATTGLIDSATKALTGDFSGAWKSLKGAASDIRDDVRNYIIETATIGMHAASSFLNGTLGLSESRGLSASDINYLRPIYGNSIDYGPVRIHKGGLEAMVGMNPHTIGNDIYLPDSYFDANGALTLEGEQLLSHEMAHVWQFQNAGAGYISEAVLSYREDRDAAYNYLDALDKQTPFHDMTPDQQAEFAKLIGMSIDITNVVDKAGLERAITDELAIDGTPPGTVVRTLSPEEVKYIQNIHQHLLAGNASQD